MSHAARFTAQVMQNPVNAALLARLDGLGAPDCWLVAGCLFQTVWNLQSDLPPDHGIRDYDIFYHDPTDLSWEAEDAVIRRGAALFADLGVRIEIRNQARVHLWYPLRFGPGYPQLCSSRDGIDRFLVECTCVGLRAGGAELYAPYGLDDLFAGVLRPNPCNLRRDRFAEKAASYQRRWPWLRILAAAAAE